jgi:phage shock protein C
MNRLFRSRSDRVMAGICGGLGNFFQIDSTVIRLIFVFFWLSTGILPLTLAYLIGIWIIPLESARSEIYPRRRMYRSRKNRMIAGICGAIAETWDIDPTVVRLVTVFICFLTGLLPGVVIYCIGWMIIPEGMNNSA